MSLLNQLDADLKLALITVRGGIDRIRKTPPRLTLNLGVVLGALTMAEAALITASRLVGDTESLPMPAVSVPLPAPKKPPDPKAN